MDCYHSPNLRTYGKLSRVMKKFIFVCFFLFFASDSFCEHPFMPLHFREPNWRTEIVRSFPNGASEVVIFYEPVNEKDEIPVKKIIFF